MPGRRARKAQEPDGQIIGRGLALLVHRPQRSDRLSAAPNACGCQRPGIRVPRPNIPPASVIDRRLDGARDPPDNDGLKSGPSRALPAFPTGVRDP
jgi:hypothetical protein